MIIIRASVTNTDLLQKVQLTAEAAMDDIEWDESSENEEAEVI